MSFAERPNNGKRWDEEADAELRRRAAEGEFIPDMARAMGRSQEAVRTRANILGLPVRSSPRGARRASISESQPQ